MRFAKYIDEHTIEQVTYVKGVPNFWLHEAVMKKLGIHLLVDDTEERDGYIKTWTRFALEDDVVRVKESSYEKIEPEASRQFSKGDFIEALIKTGLYGTVKAIYENDTDMQIFFAGFQYIDLDYTLTQDFIKKYPDVFTEDNIDAIIKEMTT